MCIFEGEGGQRFKESRMWPSIANQNCSGWSELLNSKASCACDSCSEECISSLKVTMPTVLSAWIFQLHGGLKS